MNEAVCDIIREMRRNGVCHDSRHWSELCDRIESAYKRDLKSMCDAGERDIQTAADEVTRLRNENARLKLALKPVLEVDWVEKRYNHCSGIVPTKDLNLVVREAQRIYNGGVK